MLSVLSFLIEDTFRDWFDLLMPAVMPAAPDAPIA
jgi:hypothetical protein